MPHTCQSNTVHYGLWMLCTCWGRQCRLGDGGIVQRHSTGVRLRGARHWRRGDWIRHKTRFSLWYKHTHLHILLLVSKMHKKDATQYSLPNLLYLEIFLTLKLGFVNSEQSKFQNLSIKINVTGIPSWQPAHVPCYLAWALFSLGWWYVLLKPEPAVQLFSSPSWVVFLWVALVQPWQRPASRLSLPSPTVKGRQWGWPLGSQGWCRSLLQIAGEGQVHLWMSDQRIQGPVGALWGFDTCPQFCNREGIDHKHVGPEP